MMSMCRDNIIANSTFSWWGAWLNKNNEKKIFYPNKWFGEKSSGQQTILYQMIGFVFQFNFKKLKINNQFVIVE